MKMEQCSLDFGKKLMEEIILEYEQDNPGQNGSQITADDFFNRIVQKVILILETANKPRH